MLPRINFNAKVLLPMAGIMVALVAATLWVINSSIATQVRSFAAETLFNSGVVLENFRAMRTANLLVQNRAIQSEPRFKAVTNLRDPATMRGVLNDLLTERDLDFIVYGDEDGRPLAAATRDPNLRL